jgi:hypothetical protein
VSASKPFSPRKETNNARQAVELFHCDSEELESALQLMTKAREAIRDRLRKMEALTVEAGLEVGHAHGRIRETLRHCVEQRAQFQAVWMSRETREIFKQPIATLLLSVLKGLVPELEEQERKLA